jgi:hypothetical protein
MRCSAPTAERTDHTAIDRMRRRPPKAERQLRRATQRDQESDPLLAQPSQRAGKRGLRRPIEPLNVVKCEHKVALAARGAQKAQGRGGDRAAIVCSFLTGGLSSQQRNLQRAPLWSSQSLSKLLIQRVEQIAQRREGELHLGLHRTAATDTPPSRQRLRARLTPHCRLADPRLPLDHKHSRPSTLLEERRDRAQLLLPPTTPAITA